MPKKSNKSDGFDVVGDSIGSAKKLVGELKNLYVERHDYRDARESDFKAADRKWYDASTRELTALGYRLLGDIVDDTIAKAAGMVIVIRRFVSSDGLNMAAIYQFIRPGMSVDLRVCDVESEFSDGSFLTSSNADAAKNVTMPPQIRSTKYPAKTTISELVALHDVAKRKLLKEQPNLRGLEIRTKEEYQDAQHRQDVIKAAFRRGIGYLDPAEVRRIAMQKNPDDPVAADVAAATAHIASREEQLEQLGGAAPFSLLTAMSEQGADKSPDEVAKGVVDSLLSRLPGDVPQSKRDEIAGTMKELFASAGSGNRGAELKGLVSLMAQFQSLEPKEEKERKRKQFDEAMAKAEVEHEIRQRAHVKERLARGLSEKAGTGDPGPRVFLRGLPIPDIDYEDKPRGLGEMVKEINASKRRRDAKVLGTLSIGHSRLGGLPDLPPDRAWPTHKGKKIPFVAQINLADIPAGADSGLPRRGHLYAFALISNEEEHWPPPAAVFLHEGEAASLRRADAPADDDIHPDWTGQRVYETVPAKALPPEDRKDTADEDDEYEEPDKTIGWLQGSMDDYFGTPGEIADDFFQDGDDWINLLALHSRGSMMWSDSGDLYFLIRRSALKARDFANVLAIACSS